MTMLSRTSLTCHPNTHVQRARCVQKARMAKELAILQSSPPAGISCFGAAGADPHRLLEAVIIGTPGTVNAGGTFKLEVAIPAR